MSEMVERVARKLAGQYMIDDGYGESSRASAETGEMWKNFRNAARVAIKAMREPTPEMVQASNREWDGRMSHRSTGAWQAMIDAAMMDEK